jgi:RNA polymerase sigma-70 factor (ECF subfamily)
MTKKIKSCENKSFEKAIVEETACLKRFALSRTRDSAMADDLVQDTMVLALANQHRFEMGTNLRAWLFTILKNCHLNQLRKNKGDVSYLDDIDTGTISTSPAQESYMELQDVSRAVASLPKGQRDTILVHTFQSSCYDETASRCRCTLGTVKSRLSRARSRLSQQTDAAAAAAA